MTIATRKRSLYFVIAGLLVAVPLLPPGHIAARSAAPSAAPVQVSTAGFGQFTETSIVADPTNSQNLFVGSNKGSCDSRLYPVSSFLSANSGAQWSTGNSPPVGTPGHGAVDPAPVFDANGTLYLAYLDIDCSTPTTKLASTLLVSQSTDKGITWGNPITIESPLIQQGAVTRAPDKPTLVADTTNGAFRNTLYLAYLRLSNDHPSLQVAYKAPGASAWTSIPVTAGPAADPSLSIGSHGEVYVAWWDRNDRQIRVAFSNDQGRSYLTYPDVPQLSTILSQPGCKPPNYRGNPMFTNTQIATNIVSGNLYLAWADGLPCPFDLLQDLKGATGGTLPIGDYLISYSYVTGAGEGAAGRDTTVTVAGGLFPQNAIQTPNLAGLPTNVTAVRYYIDGVPAGSGVSTGYVGSSKANSGMAPGIMIGSGGNNISAPSPRMHVYFSRSTDAGQHWSIPQRIDTGNPNDAWQPSLAVDPSTGIVSIAWYDRRDNPMSVNKFYRVYYTESVDGGLSFVAQQFPVSAGTADPTVDPAQAGTGDYMGMTSGNGSAHPVWVETHPLGGTTQSQVFTASVDELQTFVLAATPSPAPSPTVMPLPPPVSPPLPPAATMLSSRKTTAAGGYHSLAVKADGTVWAWGWNINGQLGNGTTTGSASPTQVPGFSGATAVAAGLYFSLAVKSDGTVWAWGRNVEGQLGNGTTTGSLVPVPVLNLSGVVAVAAGSAHSVALKSDGTVWAWGLNGSGQLGNGTFTLGSSVPAQVLGMTGMVGIGSGWHHSFAIRPEGSIWAWGENSPNGQLGIGSTTTHSSVPVKIAALTEVVTASGGQLDSVAAEFPGRTWSWGSNAHGMGNGSSVGSAIPLRVSNLTSSTKVSGGRWHSLAREADGTVWGWGDNFFGELGDGTTTDRFSPVQASGLTGVVDVSAGNSFSLALKADGTLWAWGSNGFGTLGIGAAGGNFPVPLAVLITGVAQPS